MTTCRKKIDTAFDRYNTHNKLCAGSINNPSEIASNIFECLRLFDMMRIKKIYCEYFDTKDIGEAVMNRLLKAASQNVIEEAKPHPDMLVYSASKAAQTNMVKSLAVQLAKDGITVNNVAPGAINTDRNKDVLEDKEYYKKVTDSIPAGFIGEPADCAGIVSLLCSEEGRYITGQSIYVDGGKCL
jgi:NAD(P)-dependent dehydrogenase (short-subunit alcohol dehydrogenase family)